MPYFNAPLYTSFMGRPAPQPARALVYCDVCAPCAIPLPAVGRDGRTGSRHWETGFKWAPRYGGTRKCDCCQESADRKAPAREEVAA